MGNEITTRAGLIDALRVASELEHGLMAQYLFALYSLKRYTWEGLDDVQLERVRRWSSQIALIARQEMEHLGLALNLLSAIGGTPSFSRPNMPQGIDYYGIAPGIELTLTRGDLETIKRFQRFEAPDSLTEGLKPGEPVDRKKARERCKMHEPPPRDRKLGLAPVLDFPWRSVQELYEAIDRGFVTLSESLGETDLFVGNKLLQIYGGPQSPLYGQMNDLNQYGLDLIPTTDLASARQAIRMIIEQGEGLPDETDLYLRHTHFCLFTGIREDMESDGLGNICARPVVPNPMTRKYPDMHGEPTILTDPDTVKIANLFNESYELMLLLLLYLYSDNVKTQDQVSDLMDAAFFPLMTMFVRPLAEILTQIPAFEDDPDGGNAGPGFELNGDVLLFPSLAATWDLFQERIDAILDGFNELVTGGNDPWIDLPGEREEPFETSRIFRRLVYLRDCMERFSIDWSAKWGNIGTTE